MASILSLRDVGKKDVGIAGVKAASLGELMRIGMPVANGFVISTKAYKEFLVESGIAARIFSMLKNYESKKIGKISESIGEIMMNYPFPEGLKQKIMAKAQEMGLRRVVVRASSIDGKSSCAALNLRTEDEIIKGIRKCWASIYSPENLKFKTRKPSNDSIAVVVQEMVFAEKGGLIHTNNDEIKVEAVHGMSSAIDSGVGNVAFVFGMDDFEKRGLTEAVQEYALIKHWKDDALIKKEVIRRPSVTEKEALNIAQIGKSIHKFYKFPQKIEFLIGDKKTYIVNCKKA